MDTDTRYIVVNNYTDRTKSYLYSHTSLVEKVGTRAVLVTKADANRVDFLAQYQADRLTSGLHSVKVYHTLDELGG